MVETLQRDKPALRRAQVRQDRREGHQPLRRRGVEGVHNTARFIGLRAIPFVSAALRLTEHAQIWRAASRVQSGAATLDDLDLLATATLEDRHESSKK
jgi:hypothetical protein